MGRIRTIKPEAFLHEGLFDLEVETGLPIRWAFAGLWCQVDRDGRFEWRPRKLKAEVLPYDQVDFARVLDALAEAGFVVRYECDGQVFGVIPSFPTHQRPNHREPLSTLPAPPVTTPPSHPAHASCESCAPVNNPPGHARADTGTPGHARVEREREGEQEGKGTEGEPRAPARPAPRLVDTSHRSHASCGRVCVPAALHQELVRKLGGNAGKADAELRAWYREVDEAWSSGDRAEQAIGDDNFAFWRARFAERAGTTRRPSPTRSTGVEAQAKHVRDKAWGRCRHEPKCESYAACVALIATDMLAQQEQPA